MVDGDYGLTGGGVSPVSSDQRATLARVVARARSISGFCFGIYVGPLPEGRGSAVAKHAELPEPSSAVLVAVDPAQRSIEIVTGRTVALDLDDRACQFATLTLVSSIGADDLVGGLRDAVLQLAEHARAPQVLHLDLP